ncbi:DUF1540 domain-containing protein, partial [Ruminococcus sp.]
MNNSYVNRSIKCTVNNCSHNNEAEHYCSLETIKVGTHESNPTVCQCTDCQSF